MRIVAVQLSKTYRGNVRALDGVDLDIPTGAFGLLGPNGAGKTTLMRILGGLLSPSSGTVQAGEHDLTTRAGRSAVKSDLGYLPQELGLYPDLSGREFLDYIALLKGIGPKLRRNSEIAELLAVVGLLEHADRKLRTFSGGMKRRLGIAQALLGQPRLLIVDEPTAALDPEERVRLRHLLSDLARNGNRTVILSTHVVEDIAQSCHELAVMNAGRVRFRGTVTELIGQARGCVWTITIPNGQAPTLPGTIVSTIQLADHTTHRLVGDRPTSDAEPVEPSLEDGYVWLMQQRI